MPRVFDKPIALQEVGPSFAVVRENSAKPQDAPDENQEKCGFDLEQLLVDIFITNGRLLHHERILCLYSEYLQMSFKLNNYLLNNQTVLPVSYRYYLSIMAVSCYNCEYLLKIQEE